MIKPVLVRSCEITGKFGEFEIMKLWRLNDLLLITIVNEIMHRQITFIELKKLNTSDLIFKLKQNRGNLKGIREYLKKFGVKNKHSSGLSKLELGSMVVVTLGNLDVIFGEIERRIRGKY